jgi:hypothetical protein
MVHTNFLIERDTCIVGCWVNGELLALSVQMEGINSSKKMGIQKKIYSIHKKVVKKKKKKKKKGERETEGIIKENILCYRCYFLGMNGKIEKMQL